MPDLALDPLFVNESGVYAGKTLGRIARDVVAPGIEVSTDLEVTQRGAGANLSVDVAAGACWILGNDSNDTYNEQPNYWQLSQATVNVPLTTADPTNPRIDLIVVKVYDDQFSGASKKGAIEPVDGTPAGSPVAPTQPENTYVLAQVQVDANETTILDADITDQRSLATIPGELGLGANSVGTSQIQDASITTAKLDAGLAANTVPPGAISAYAGTTAPTGWLLCDGAEVSRTTYAGLFAVIGITFGNGNGSTTFDLPDMRGRVALTLDNLGGSSANVITDSNADSLGGEGGVEETTLTSSHIPQHSHDDGSLTIPNHSHSDGSLSANVVGEVETTTTSSWGASTLAGGGPMDWYPNNRAEVSSFDVTGNTGTVPSSNSVSGSTGNYGTSSPTPVSAEQPWMALGAIIKT